MEVIDHNRTLRMAIEHAIASLNGRDEVYASDVRRDLARALQKVQDAPSEVPRQHHVEITFMVPARPGRPNSGGFSRQDSDVTIRGVVDQRDMRTINDALHGPAMPWRLSQMLILGTEAEQIARAKKQEQESKDLSYPITFQAPTGRLIEATIQFKDEHGLRAFLRNHVDNLTVDALAFSVSATVKR